MERPSPLNTAFLSLVPLAALFAFVFWRVLLLDLDHTRLIGQALQDHLRYTLRLKDDMGTIDWGKSLESFPELRAFSVTKDNTEIVSGGNRQRVPGPGPEGVRFQFPDSLLAETYLETEGTGKIRFIFVSDPLWDPWAVAGLSSLGVLSLVLGALFLFRPRKTADPVPGTFSGERSDHPVIPDGRPPFTPLSTTDLPPGGLLIDPQFKILQLGPRTSELLGLSPNDLMNGHLLDLFPDPSLLQAIEKREKQKVFGAFMKAPEVATTLEPAPEGFLLILESPQGSRTPKNP